MKKIIFSLVVLGALSACTEQQRAKQFGGEAKIDLPAGRRLVTATWKEDDLWLLTRQDPATPADTYELAESSSFGVLEGVVVIVEH